MKFSDNPDRLNFDFASEAARRDYLDLDEDAQDAFGSGFMALQVHSEPLVESKVLSHFGSAKVRELIYKDDSGTYRAAYTIEFEDFIYMLHAWKKKSTKGISTAKADIEKIKKRIEEARERHEQWLHRQQGGKHGRS